MNTVEVTPRSLTFLRLLIGLAQGMALWLLDEASRQEIWPGTDAAAARALLAMTIFAPAVTLVGIGSLRPRTLAIWATFLAVLCIGLGVHSQLRDPPGARFSYYALLLPDLYVSLLLIAFVGHAIVTSVDEDRQQVRGPGGLFDIYGRHALLLALAGWVIGMLWGALWLGASLFGLIGLDGFSMAIFQPWFALPFTTVAAALTIDVVTRRAALMKGIGSMLLGLMAWLLPPLVALGMAFFMALLFTGLAPLWATRRATAILVAMAVVLVLLINSAPTGGASAGRRFGVFTHVRLLAALMLTPLIVLAVIGLALRVEQHGWTPGRIYATAGLLPLVGLALGYAAAALRSGAALRGLAQTNLVAACATFAIAVLLATPLADPARLAVADQMARLQSGRTDAATFDYRMLREQGFRYGWEALDRLKSLKGDPRSDAIAALAAAERELSYRQY